MPEVPATGGILELAIQSIAGGDFQFGTPGEDGISEATYTVDGATRRAAFAMGLANGQRLMKKAAEYDAIEVIASPNGSIVGPGQPRLKSGESRCAAVTVRLQAMAQ